MTIIIISIIICSIFRPAEITPVFICICNAVSDKRIRQEAAGAGRVLTLRDLKETLSVGTCCGKCMPAARTLLDGLNGPVRSAASRTAMNAIPMATALAA